MRWYWVKIVLRNRRGEIVGPAAHVPIAAWSEGAALDSEAVKHAENRVWSWVHVHAHPMHYLETICVELSRGSTFDGKPKEDSEGLQRVPSGDDVFEERCRRLLGDMPAKKKKTARQRREEADHEAERHFQW